MLDNYRWLMRVAFLAVTTTLPACAMFDGTKRMKDPATVDIMDATKSGRTISQAVTSDRRMILIRGDKACLEAPPDTASNISASYSGALDASLKAAKGDVAPDVKASYANQLAQALNHITNPSQGILFMRFAMASACTAYMNGAINSGEYYDMMNGAMASAVAMTMFELEKNGGKVGNNVEAVTQTAPSLSGSVVSVAQAQSIATQAAKTNASSAGPAAAAAAGQDAGDAVKQMAGANSTEGVASTTGQAAHDAVLKTTQDPKKAEAARVQAIQRVFQFAAENVKSVPAVEQRFPHATAPSATPNFIQVLDKATTPLRSLKAGVARKDNP